MADRDYYEVLGVIKTATDDDPKTAKDKMTEINAAYDVLKDKDKRVQYDLSFFPAFA